MNIYFSYNNNNIKNIAHKKGVWVVYTPKTKAMKGHKTQDHF